MDVEKHRNVQYTLRNIGCLETYIKLSAENLKIVCEMVYFLAKSHKNLLGLNAAKNVCETLG